VEDFLGAIAPTDAVADIGGGKKPVLGVLGARSAAAPEVYDGFDIDLSELEQAKQFYTSIHFLDLNAPGPPGRAAL